MDHAALEVHRGPSQASKLAEPQPGRGQQTYDECRLGVRDLEERRDLHGRECLDLVLVPRPMHVLERICARPAESPRVPEERA
jgi:hypothetical protein